MSYPSPPSPLSASGRGETTPKPAFLLQAFTKRQTFISNAVIFTKLTLSRCGGGGRGEGACVALAVVLFVLAFSQTANAHPRFAKAEGVSCAYCHVNPKGGGKRNYRGDFYEKSLSFVEFNDEAEAKKAGVEVGPEADKKPASLVKGASVLPLPPKPAPQPTPAPKAPFVDPASVADFGEWVSPEGIVFVKIPAGKYVRGTTDLQKAELQKANQWSPLNAVEMPAQTVTISRPFLMSKTEVTQKDWNALMVPPDGPVKFNKNGKPIKKKDAVENPSAFKKGGDAPNRPVENVSWWDAKAFCKTLMETAKESGDTRGKYRLPTEAEWEYAARAGSDGFYPMGPDKKPETPAALGEMAWMNNNSANTTHPVGKKAPNAWGLYDMAGNVWEWCEDAFSPTAYKELPTADPVYQSKYATERVMRGGCWFLDARAQRVNLRGGNLPTLKSQYVGFRLVREL